MLRSIKAQEIAQADARLRRGSHLRSAVARVHDFRNRQTSVDGELELDVASTYNNLNQVIQVDRRNTTAGGQLLALSQTFFDDRGRTYRTKQFEVDPSTGAVGNALVNNTWFDGAENTILSQSAASGTRTWNGYVTNPSDPLAAAKIFEQSEATYDGAGQMKLTAMLQRSRVVARRA